MKTPTARQLPSGSWFVRVKVNGVEHPITCSTKREAEREALALKSGAKKTSSADKCTLYDAIDHYITSLKKKSPATIQGYRSIQRNRFQSAMDWNIYRVQPAQWQRLVDSESEEVSKKTVKNSWGLVAAAVKKETGEAPEIVLEKSSRAKSMRRKVNFLSAAEIPIFVEQIRGDSCEIEMLLALHSLRRSEILDMTWDDIDLEKRMIHVHGAAVYGEDHILHHKEENKTESSARDIPILIPRLEELVAVADKSSKYIYTGYPNVIIAHVKNACKKAGITVCTLHDLRRSFASLCYHCAVSDFSCCLLGGWSDYKVVREFYTMLSLEDKNDDIQKLRNFFTPSKPKRYTRPRRKGLPKSMAENLLKEDAESKNKVP